MNGGARNVIAGEYAAEALAEARWAAYHKQQEKLQELRSAMNDDVAFDAWQKKYLTGSAGENLKRIAAALEAQAELASIPAAVYEAIANELAPTDCTCPACTAADILAD